MRCWGRSSISCCRWRRAARCRGPWSRSGGVRARHCGAGWTGSLPVSESRCSDRSTASGAPQGQRAPCLPPAGRPGGSEPRRRPLSRFHTRVTLPVPAFAPMPGRKRCTRGPSSGRSSPSRSGARSRRPVLTVLPARIRRLLRTRPAVWSARHARRWRAPSFRWRNSRLRSWRVLQRVGRGGGCWGGVVVLFEVVVGAVDT